MCDSIVLRSLWTAQSLLRGSVRTHTLSTGISLLGLYNRMDRHGPERGPILYIQGYHCWAYIKRMDRHGPRTHTLYTGISLVGLYIIYRDITVGPMAHH